MIRNHFLQDTINYKTASLIQFADLKSKQRTFHSKRFAPSVFPPQKFEQREICEQPVQRETFLHSLDLIAHP